ncbi:tyrosine decarboxylase 1 isoform X2 [Selaginella moellendorffii]|uniref:tyrosine decarboxylase 1 isoform X2 n=1 Tax=Selaginella moellendorffii TaxID=88036 RepID=UPI000D1C8DD3|nr:tyrosine decarboxylase 1 isoform X2 [Selaginella moellendorffii]|eukprot:XP_024515922.1 tyrosine decarboxylase 1 isoform X2 [Selaginella moellendorffii]
MDPQEFRAQAHKMVDFIADYYRDVESLPVRSQVTPGYLRSSLPSNAPEEPQSFDTVLDDVKSMIVPGVTHWQNPNFFGFFPSNSSTAGMLGEFLSGGFNVDGSEWATSPAATELEMLVLNWLGKLLNLPDEFLFNRSGNGGGVIHASASEAVLVALLAARGRAISENKAKGLEEQEILSKLLVYTSDQTHPCLHKACIVGLPKSNLVILPTLATDDYALSLPILKSAVRNGVTKGFIPFFLGATVGTTSSSAIDPLPALADIAKEYGMWFHVDAAYAGNACICPEFRHFLNGVENAHSFNLSANKWLLTNIDCSILWLKDSKQLSSTLSTLTNKELKTSSIQSRVVNFKDWQVAQGRRFRSLKLWFVMRLYGALGLRNHIRTHINHAKHFEILVREDSRFEILAPCRFGLVCFRLKPSVKHEDNGWKLNSSLLEAINSGGKIFMTHTVLSGVYTLRMSIGGTQTKRENVDDAWKIIQEEAQNLLDQEII